LNSRVQEVKCKTQSVPLLFGLAGVGAAMTHLAEGPLVALLTLALVALAGASAVAHNFPVCSTAVVGRLAVAGGALVSFVAQAFAAQAPAVPLGQNKISDHHRGFTERLHIFFDALDIPFAICAAKQKPIMLSWTMLRKSRFLFIGAFHPHFSETFIVAFNFARIPNPFVVCRLFLQSAHLRTAYSQTSHSGRRRTRRSHRGNWCRSPSGGTSNGRRHKCPGPRTLCRWACGRTPAGRFRLSSRRRTHTSAPRSLCYNCMSER